MSDTAKRIGPVLLGTAPVAVYTAVGPVEIRNLNFANTSGTAATVTVSTGPDAVGTRLMPGFSIPANTLYTWSGLVPLEPGEALYASSGTAGVVTLTGSGTVGVD